MGGMELNAGVPTAKHFIQLRQSHMVFNTKLVQQFRFDDWRARINVLITESFS
jgi:hypothetical protein